MKGEKWRSRALYGFLNDARFKWEEIEGGEKEGWILETQEKMTIKNSMKGKIWRSNALYGFSNDARFN